MKDPKAKQRKEKHESQKGGQMCVHYTSKSRLNGMPINIGGTRSKERGDEEEEEEEELLEGEEDDAEEERLE